MSHIRWWYQELLTHILLFWELHRPSIFFFVITIMQSSSLLLFWHNSDCLTVKRHVSATERILLIATLLNWHIYLPVIILIIHHTFKWMITEYIEISLNARFLCEWTESSLLYLQCQITTYNTHMNPFTNTYGCQPYRKWHQFITINREVTGTSYHPQRSKHWLFPQRLSSLCTEIHKS